MKFFSRMTCQISALAVSVLLNLPAVASVVISGTRVIYPSDAKEVSVKISNVGPSPVLLQSWVDSGDANANPSAIKVPFVLTPPINRVEASKGQTLRISYVGGGLPMDKESVFWLNVLEIPAKNQTKTNENRLQIAFRSRIKLFYRPVGLEGNANDVATSIRWHVQGDKIQAANPTPYYASLVTLSVNGKKLENVMLAPRSSQVLEIPGQAGSKINGAFVNDYGAVLPFNAVVK
ncbi:fimbria/pilus periplasmic chaperone [Serratia fonticola]|nr:fimbria/pilus periplasmic chaperone [Serratia fonticola]NYA41441.1 fimbria/pilus periplasmic chaperone [Serratia fonticola]